MELSFSMKIMPLLFRCIPMKFGRQVVFPPLLADSIGKYGQEGTSVFQSSTLWREGWRAGGRHTDRYAAEAVVDFCFLESSHQLPVQQKSMEKAS